MGLRPLGVQLSSIFRDVLLLMIDLRGESRGRKWGQGIINEGNSSAVLHPVLDSLVDLNDIYTNMSGVTGDVWQWCDVNRVW